MDGEDDAPQVESELAGIERKTSKVLDAIESVGISDSLADRLRTLEADKRDAEKRLEAARFDAGQLDAPPDLVPALMGRWRALVDDFEGLAGNPTIEPGELDTAERIYTPCSDKSHFDRRAASYGHIRPRTQKGLPK